MEKYMSMRDVTSPIERTINCGCRTNKEGSFVDLLNKEIEELQKAKAIEEMASDMDYACTSKDLYPSDAKEIAKTLYLLNYRKLTEDSVVLSKEEYEEYKKVANGKAIMVENIADLNKLVQFPIEYDSKIFDELPDFGNYVQEQSRKETAEKILNEQYQECKEAEQSVLKARGGNKNDAYYKGFSLGMTNTKMHIKELAQQCGVEIKE